MRTTSAQWTGFSLIELLTVVSITALVSLVSVSVLVNSQLRSTKATTVARVRQEGEFATRELEYLLRNARYILANQYGQTCTTGMSAIRVATGDDNIVEIYTSEDSRIASNSGKVVTEEPAAYLTSSAVRLKSALALNCKQEPYQGGALVEYTFTLSTGEQDSISAEAYYEQAFSGHVYVRSYQ